MRKKIRILLSVLLLAGMTWVTSVAAEDVPAQKNAASAYELSLVEVNRIWIYLNRGLETV